MKEAKVFYAEDNPEFRETVTDIIESGGHTVVAAAATIEEAEDIIPKLKALGVQIAVLDANLKEGDISGKHARIMVNLIHSLCPGMKIIGLSTTQFPVTVDVDLGAQNRWEISGVIDRL